MAKKEAAVLVVVDMDTMTYTLESYKDHAAARMEAAQRGFMGKNYVPGTRMKYFASGIDPIQRAAHIERNCPGATPKIA